MCNTEKLGIRRILLFLPFLTLCWNSHHSCHLLIGHHGSFVSMLYHACLPCILLRQLFFELSNFLLWFEFVLRLLLWLNFSAFLFIDLLYECAFTLVFQTSRISSWQIFPLLLELVTRPPFQFSTFFVLLFSLLLKPMTRSLFLFLFFWQLWPGRLFDFRSIGLLLFFFIPLSLIANEWMIFFIWPCLKKLPT